MFDAVPILVSDRLESEPVSMEGSLGPRCAVDEKHSGFDVVVLGEFDEEAFGQRLRPRWKKPNMDAVGRIGTDSGVQPEPMIVDLDHGFVERDVIRTRAIDWL